MADGLTTPFPANTKFATKDLGAAGHAQTGTMADFAGADVFGLVVDAPAAFSLLGRLKAIWTAILSMAPASVATAISPHDTNQLSGVTRSIYVGGAGDVTLRMNGAGADVVFKAVPAGTTLPITASHVRATGTNATFLVALS